MQYPLEHLQVLVVDSNRFMRTVLNGVLRALGVGRAFYAADSAEALKEIKVVQPDIMITEYDLQPLNGLEFLRLVRTGTDTTSPFIPVLMLTSYTERYIVEGARDAGVNEFLAKPISAAAMGARIRAIVMRPRPFVKTRTYFGPDRRRSLKSRHNGPDRRVFGASPDAFYPVSPGSIRPDGRAL